MAARVLVVDDHPLTREALAALLRSHGFELAGIASDGEEAIAAAAETQPDLVLLDLLMPGLDGLSALPRLREAAPGCEVVVLTASGTEENLLAAIRGGAAGYLLKTESPERIAEFLDGVVHGDAALSGPVARRLLDQVRSGGRGSGVPDRIASVLSARELEVLLLLDEHHGTDEIAQRLFISEHTVRSHVKSLLRKLGVSSRREALEQLALARGYRRKAVERRVDEPRQRLEVVAALEDGCDAVGQSPAAARELAEAVLCDVHVRKRVSHVCVEAGRDEDELRLEPLNGGLDYLRERLEVLLVPGAGPQRDVDRRLRLVVRTAAARVERPLVERDEEDAVVVAEDRVGAVAVVDVEVDDRDPVETEALLSRARRHRDVVEDAEAHRAPREGVVARRADEREPAAQRRLDRGPRRERRSLERRRGADRVRVEPDGILDAVHELDVLRGVAEL